MDFLDATGNWDPTLALALGGTMMIMPVRFRFILRRARPVYGAKFHLPTRSDVDSRPIGGTAILVWARVWPVYAQARRGHRSRCVAAIGFFARPGGRYARFHRSTSKTSADPSEANQGQTALGSPINGSACYPESRRCLYLGAVPV
ncbi:DUF6691 family protein [Rhodanobacter sp. UC4450_H17]